MTETPAYQNLEPREVWQHFAALNNIPRPSEKEEAARQYVRQSAEAAGATWQEDEAGNIVVRVRATTEGNASTPTVAIQSHLDMVCEKRPDVAHNFDTDPIVPRRDGNRIYATGTTLGADNGIGAAMALATLTTPGLQHGPIELLFTVEEETGLYGAMKLDPSLLQSSMLINLDSEDPDEITVGCAGGGGTILRLPVETESAPSDWPVRGIVVSGLQGGHSGIQVHEPLANALKLLTGVLVEMQSNGVEFRLVSVDGGSAHNAIPRDARATLAVAPHAVDQFEAGVLQSSAALREEWAVDEPGLQVQLSEASESPRALTQSSGTTLLRLLDALPHGVLSWSESFPGKVETSSNLAHVHTRDDEVEVSTSSRSFITAQLEAAQERIRVLGEQSGAVIEVRGGYPGWEPRADSQLLQVARAAYERIYNRAPQVEVVHAGLECGAIVSKLPGMEAISFGPLIRGPHTPEEFVEISSVASTWQLLTELLQSLGRKQS